jgi:acyl-CoA dehydrogenase
VSEVKQKAAAGDPSSETRALLAETVNRLLGEGVTRERLVEAEGGAWLGSLWDDVEDAGLLRPHLAESAGGAGAGWREAFVVARVAGRHSVPLPIAETMLGAWLLSRAGLDVPGGPLAIAPRPVPANALRGGRIEATLARVPWGRHARHAVVVLPGQADARALGRSIVACVPLEGAEVRTGWSVALEPRDDVAVAAVPVSIGEVDLAPPVPGALGAMVRAAQMAGALETLLDLAVAYANERIQFGRPIGKFQVIQQELARLAGQVAAAGTAAEVAFRATDEAVSFAGDVASPGDPTFEIACAKVVAGEAAELGPRIAHQVHGAIGFTYEHSLHFATRRLWSWRSEFGTTEEWAARLGAHALAGGADGLWSSITAR